MDIKQTLIYDLNTLPEDSSLDGNMIDMILKGYTEGGIVFYDSSRDGIKPEVVNVSDMEVVFTDVSKQEGMKKFNNYKEKLK